MTFDDLLAPYDPPIRPPWHGRYASWCFRWRRTRIRKCTTVGAATFCSSRAPRPGNTVCHITVAKKHVSLGISQAQQLADPSGLLQGTGKHSAPSEVQDV